MFYTMKEKPFYNYTLLLFYMYLILDVLSLPTKQLHTLFESTLFTNNIKSNQSNQIHPQINQPSIMKQ